TRRGTVSGAGGWVGGLRSTTTALAQRSTWWRWWPGQQRLAAGSRPAADRQQTGSRPAADRQQTGNRTRPPSSLRRQPPPAPRRTSRGRPSGHHLSGVLAWGVGRGAAQSPPLQGNARSHAVASTHDGNGARPDQDVLVWSKLGRRACHAL